MNPTTVAGYLIWFRHIAGKRGLDGSACALYHYIVGECLWSNTDNVRLTQEMMASALHVGKSTVNRSLKTLQECRLIKGGDGNYTVLRPDEDWLGRNYWSRVQAESMPKQNPSPEIPEANPSEDMSLEEFYKGVNAKGRQEALVRREIPEQDYSDEIQEPDFSDKLKAEFGEGYEATPEIPEPQEKISDEELLEKQKDWAKKSAAKRAEIAAKRAAQRSIK